MVFKFALSIFMATATIKPLPAWLAPPSQIYQACLYNAIDRQYETGRFSEKAVLSRCAAVRRSQVKAAELALSKATGTEDGRAMIDREFARLDESVWTIVGHIRARRSNQRSDG